MKRAFLPGLLCVLLVSSCDEAKEVASKAKDVVSDAKEAVSEGIVHVIEAKKDPGVPDPELAALVDSNEQGYLFRSDLPFPEKITTTNQSEFRMTGRLARVSVFGDEIAPVTGSVMKRQNRYEKDGGRVLVEMGELLDLQKPREEGDDEIWKTLKPAGRLSVVWTEGKWKPVQAAKEALDFSAAAEFLDTDFKDTMISEGLSPRPFWFGKGRIKVGDKLTLTGEQMKLFDNGAKEGRIDIVLEGIEPVHGHPCGMFSVTADYNGTHGFGKGDVTVEAGKAWLSLLHPVMLKADLKMIMTGRGKGEKESGMGSVDVRRELEWKAGG